ncbi:MAG: hypothetical protein K0R73_1337 [Candidatus Midichloriaceae bacterium]|nr:hypothetical protein [Candidatus Midichloriaceae bacterium]
MRNTIQKTKKIFKPKLSKSLIKEHFDNGTFVQLKEILDMHRKTTIVKLFSMDNYELFRHIAVRHNIGALNFIINIVPEESAYNMVHYGNLSPFRCFLIETRILEEQNTLNHHDRIEGFKIFLKIDYESIQKTLSAFEINSLETRSMKESIRKDFNIALKQLQEEGKNQR